MLSKNNNVFAEGVSWEEIIKILKTEDNQQFLKHIQSSTFKYVLDEGNRPKVIESLLKVLKRTDPQNATQEYANALVETMRKAAKMILR